MAGLDGEVTADHPRRRPDRPVEEHRHAAGGRRAARRWPWRRRAAELGQDVLGPRDVPRARCAARTAAQRTIHASSSISPARDTRGSTAGGSSPAVVAGTAAGRRLGAGAARAEHQQLYAGVGGLLGQPPAVAQRGLHLLSATRAGLVLDRRGGRSVHHLETGAALGGQPRQRALAGAGLCGAARRLHRRLCRPPPHRRGRRAAAATRTEPQAAGVGVPWVAAAKPHPRSSTPRPAPGTSSVVSRSTACGPAYSSGIGSSMPGWMTSPVDTIGNAMVGAAQALPGSWVGMAGGVWVSTSGSCTSGVGSASARAWPPLRLAAEPIGAVMVAGAEQVGRGGGGLEPDRLTGDDQDDRVAGVGDRAGWPRPTRR